MAEGEFGDREVFAFAKPVPQGDIEGALRGAGRGEEGPGFLPNGGDIGGRIDWMSFEKSGKGLQFCGDIGCGFEVVGIGGSLSVAGDSVALNAQKYVEGLPACGTRNAKDIARVQGDESGVNLHPFNAKSLNKIYQHRIGTSVQGRELVAEANFDLAGSIRPANLTLIIGGLHGDEKATVALVATFREEWVVTHEVRAPVMMIPLANPDGFVANSRYNANGVDLNRNCDLNWDADCPEPAGPHPWSEPESRAVRDFILAFEPAKVVSLHWALAEIDADGPQSTGLARRMWNAMTEEDRGPYRIRTSARDVGGALNGEGFCPGSFGEWCGYGLRFAGGLRPAMITLELPHDPEAESRPNPLPAEHLLEMHARWEECPTGYLEAVEPAVHKMLAAACAYPR